MRASAVLPDGFDLTDLDVNLAGVPHEQFAALRRAAPVAWVEQPPESRAGMTGGDGYWAVTRHADVSTVSKNTAVFSSSENGVIVRFASDMTRDAVELNRLIIINQDPPEHTQTRRIISRGFTPRAIAAVEEVMRTRAHQIVADAVAAGSGNFVEQVAAVLPLEVIADMLGVPPEDRRKLFDWTNQLTSSEDPDYANDPALSAIEMLGYAHELSLDRHANPRDDIATTLLNADKDGRGLTDDEFCFFVMALAVAGNETTRNAMSHGMAAMLDNPEQWELWKRERPDTAVDEIIRWATPVTSFQRTATCDVELGGAQVAAGQRVVIFYGSANYDEDVFTDPYTFDITRSPNPHLAFGGNGAHYCIGANLARLEIRLIFDELAEQAPHIVRTGPTSRLRSGWLNGIKALPVDYARATEH